MHKPRHPIAFLATTEPDAAQAFYTDVMGLTLKEASPYALVYQDGDTMLRVQIVADLTPAAHTVHGWDVADIAVEIADLTAKGVRFLTFDGMGQSVDGVWTTPNGDQIAWFKDTSGNILSLTQFV